MMETPLDVLSRAATLVETDPKEGDMGYAMGGRSESPKELPSRTNRQRRSVERREGPLVMRCGDGGDHNHKATSTAATSTRCASTQTLITSEMVGIPEINPDLPIPSSSGLMSQESLHKRPSATIPPPPHPSLRHRNMPQQLLRPSVITCAPAPLLREPNRTDGGPVAMVPGAGAGLGPVPPPYLNGRASSAERWSAKNHLPLQPQNADIDPDIEEHFRRSLGQNYRETYSSPPPTATSPPAAPSPTLRQSSSPKEVNITGSVDDHFAKALGDKWSQIKDVIEPVSNRTSPSVSPSLALSSSPVVQQQQASVAS